MKIGIIGTHSTGKTTLIKTLSEDMEDFKLHIISEQARKVLKEFGVSSAKDLREDTTKARIIQWEILLRQIRNEVANYNGFISDGTPLDIAAYWLAYIDPVRSMRETDVFLGICKRCFTLYDFAFYLSPSECPFEIDDIRDPDPNFRIIIDERIQFLMNEWRKDWTGAIYPLFGNILDKTRMITKIISEGYQYESTGYL